jgi:light-regulated signal transduction histidine kinase (bacteriophytochrome)/DNA-binding response OmpR family regulator
MAENDEAPTYVWPTDFDPAICEREPIHTPGAIQPHGALLAIDLASRRITHASANLGAFLGVPAEAALDRSIAEVLGEDATSLLARLDQRARAAFFEARSEITRDGRWLHVRAHGSGRRLLIDIEPTDGLRQPGSVLAEGRSLLDSFSAASNRVELCELAVNGLRTATGFDQVLAYRFAPKGDGEVIAEARVEGVESYLGLRFPASDIPPQARTLYLRQRVGSLVDRDYIPSPLLADRATADSEPLDLTHSALRGMSPLHLEYMRNMGTAATLRISLVHHGSLWGLLVCNHMSPRPIDPRTRAMADLIGQTMSLMLGSLGEAEALVEREARAARLKALLDFLAAPAPLFEALAAAQSDLLDFMSASGAMIRAAGEVVLLGQTPPRAVAERMAAELSREAWSDCLAIDDLGSRHPEFASCAETASGVLLLWLEPDRRGDAIVWFRPERARAVVWGGNPYEHIRFDRATGRIYPRTSFSAWKEIMSGCSAPWTETDLQFAREFRGAFGIEIGRRNKAELGLKTKFLEVTLQHMNQGILMFDSDRRVQVCNDGAVRSLGLSKPMLDERPRLEEVIEELSRRGQPSDDLVRKRGVFFPSSGPAGEATIVERRGADGLLYEVRSMPMPGGGFVSTYTDVTDRKAAEAELRAAHDRAQAATKAKSEFLATMSHEIRSPLSGLIGVIELLRESPLQPEQLRMADLASNSAYSLLAVLNDILTFSKIEADGLTIFPEATSLQDLVEAVAEPHKLTAARKGVDLSWRLDPDLPDWISVDPLRLRQILANLLSNAVKFTLAGAIDLHVEKDVAEPHARMRFTVRDSGIGMSESVLGRLFEPFVQADASTTRDFGGTGLGLSISLRLAKLLGGTLRASSVFGEGSAFVLTLPLRPAHLPEAPVTASSLAQTTFAAKGWRVLVVDDDPSIRWLTQRYLEILDVSVETADDGESALQKVRAENYDIVFTDCHMPRMDGIALTRAIRGEADRRLQALPIIGFTADVTESQRLRALGAGMADVAIKPVSRSQLAELLAVHLDSERTSRTDALPAMASQSAEFDPSTYLDAFTEDDPDGRAWLADYFAMAQSVIGDLGRIVSGADPADLPRQEIAEAAHALAGASLTVGAHRLGKEARSLQHAALTDAGPRLIERVETLRHELDGAHSAVRAFLGEDRHFA